MKQTRSVDLHFQLRGFYSRSGFQFERKAAELQIEVCLYLLSCSQRRFAGKAKCNAWFNGELRDECLNGEIFHSLKEAQIVIESWWKGYNTVRPHAALGYRPPAPGAYSPAFLPKPISRPQAVM